MNAGNLGTHVSGTTRLRNHFVQTKSSHANWCFIFEVGKGECVHVCTNQQSVMQYGCGDFPSDNYPFQQQALLQHNEAKWSKKEDMWGYFPNIGDRHYLVHQRRAYDNIFHPRGIKRTTKHTLMINVLWKTMHVETSIFHLAKFFFSICFPANFTNEMLTSRASSSALRCSERCVLQSPG